MQVYLTIPTLDGLVVQVMLTDIKAFIPWKDKITLVCTGTQGAIRTTTPIQEFLNAIEEVMLEHGATN